MKTTAILAPGAWGRVGLNCTFFPFPEECREYREYRENSGRLIWHYKNNGFDTFGPENDLRFLYNFDSQGRIYLKVESVFFEQNSAFWFSRPNLAKSWRSIFTKVHQIPGPPPRGSKELPRRPQRVQRVPQGIQRAPQNLFWTPNLYIWTPDHPQSGRYL